MAVMDSVVNAFKNSQIFSIVTIGTLSSTSFGRFYTPTSEVLFIELKSGAFIEVLSTANTMIHLSIVKLSILDLELIFNQKEAHLSRIESLLVDEYSESNNVTLVKAWYQENSNLEDCYFCALELVVGENGTILFFSSDSPNNLKVGNQVLRDSWLRLNMEKNLQHKVYELGSKN
jgi:hypothetical protein